MEMRKRRTRRYGRKWVVLLRFKDGGSEGNGSRDKNMTGVMRQYRDITVNEAEDASCIYRMKSVCL